MSLPYEYCLVALFAKCGIWWYSDPMLVVMKACADLWRSIRVPGEIKRSRDLRGGRWSWTLTFAQKRS